MPVVRGVGHEEALVVEPEGGLRRAEVDGPTVTGIEDRRAHRDPGTVRGHLHRGWSARVAGLPECEREHLCPAAGGGEVPERDTLSAALTRRSGEAKTTVVGLSPAPGRVMSAVVPGPTVATVILPLAAVASRLPSRSSARSRSCPTAVDGEWLAGQPWGSGPARSHTTIAPSAASVG